MQDVLEVENQKAQNKVYPPKEDSSRNWGRRFRSVAEGKPYARRR